MRSKSTFVFVITCSLLCVGNMVSQSAQLESEPKQSNSNTVQDTTSELLEQIISDQKSWLASLDSMDIHDMKKSVVDNLNPSQPGVVTGYDNGLAITKITSAYLGETGRLEEYYYLSEGELFYVKTVNVDYKVPIDIDAFAGMRESTVNEYHILNGEIIRWVTTRTKIVPEDSLHQESFDKLNSEAQRYLELLDTSR